jgi:lysophospholipase L1-like esterase
MSLSTALVKLVSGYLQINNYDCIVIFCGTNDYEKACDDKLPTNEIIDLIQGRVNAIINVLRQAIPKTKLAFLCILPRPKDDHSPKLGEDLRKVNGAIKALCNARKVVFLNAFRAVSTKGALDRKKFGEDGLHLSYKGVEGMKDFFRGATCHLLRDTFSTTGRDRYVPFEDNPSVAKALGKE